MVCLFVAIVKDCGMTAAEARRNMTAGIFGKIIGFSELRDPVKIPNDGWVKGYQKTLHGKITDVDRTMIEFTDTMGELHLFRGSHVKMFRPVGIKTMKMPKKFIQK